MTLTRRAFSGGGVALAAAAIVSGPAVGQGTVRVRRSVGDLIREHSPQLDSYSRAVDVMMKRDVKDKTSWWFQANIHGIPDEEITDELKPLVQYWQQCPHQNYFFLSWHRMYLHFFERIVRKASGDGSFALPYWAYDDPQQSSLPEAFRPDIAELGTPPQIEPLAPLLRHNPLARAKRFAYVDRCWIGLGNVVTDVTATLALDRFATDDKLEALRVFGGVRTADPLAAEAAGGMEAAPHNLVHKTIGLEGDMGSPETAARDPIFWLHHANIDRLWVKWMDRNRGRVPPLDDQVWMKTKFTFVDDDGNDQIMTGADVLDTQFQLGYRYDDDPPRSQPLEMDVPVALAPGAGSASGFVRSRPQAPPIVLARGIAVRLAERENIVSLVAASVQAGGAAISAPRLRVILREVMASDRSPPYDVFLIGSPAAGAASVRIGALDLFGGTGHGQHAQHGGGTTIALEASDAVAQLSRTPGFDLRDLQVIIQRRGFPDARGGEFVPPDPDPPRIGAIELIRS